MMQKRLQLANGLRVNLTHSPQASHAAALFHLSAGSHHEPSAWPGLAHLFEHVVFAGSQHYQGSQRLMSWAQAEGARLNATTLPTMTAWFFDIAAPKLDDGFARLVDMLARPLLAADSIAQEMAVIDAEFKMLSTDTDTLCEAALGAALISPTALTRFHVGNLAHFGQDIDSLQQALSDYHQQYFHSGNLTLWLSGPQSVEELAALATQYATLFPAAQEKQSPLTQPLTLGHERDFSMQSGATPRLQLSFTLPETHRPDASSLTLLRQILTDEAQNSLLAALRTQGCCDTVQLSLPYCSENGSIISIEMMLNDARPETAARAEALFQHGLRHLRTVSPLQLHHYANLAAQPFSQLTPVDKLRATAFGFPPIEQSDAELLAGWQSLLDQLKTDNLTRLWVTPNVNNSTRCVQGFELALAPITWPAVNAIDLPKLAFYPQNSVPERLYFPAEKVGLPQIKSEYSEGVLILSPAAATPLTLRNAHQMQASLRAIVGDCAHRGGSLSFERYQGQWLLQLSGTDDVILSTLNALIVQLLTMPKTLQDQGERQYLLAEKALQSDIAIRCLLNQLPRLLSGEATGESEATNFSRLHWNAALYGGSSGLLEGIAHLLSRFPGHINDEKVQARAPRAAEVKSIFPTDSEDAAVLLFCPLPEQTAVCLAAWRILASFFEPRFFQRLRVEQNMGYVVTCRFMQSAGESGIMFAVQSPSYSAERIYAEIQQFIVDMQDIILETSPTLFAEKCSALRHSIEVPAQDKLEQTRERWLSAHAYAPLLTAEAISSLTLSTLQHFQQQLVQKTAPWWILNNQPLLK
ncbi:pyrroloquinoline quinone biosynthesis protein PqqF [Rouxiella sp. S1S-2]|uniref:pyrroloquinoline quinone biosynthesis protein PqqF n=1 Tax=Rouxiella sp. S1S-2 TaxID=2653856 RepID=UPI001D03036F|nr:pyrroloquinoline quinone biosynthesis protein PqqF [Rouxiella sp. S1S-2]